LVPVNASNVLLDEFYADSEDSTEADCADECRHCIEDGDHTKKDPHKDEQKSQEKQKFD
jgi:hypothetical protein